MTLSERLGDFVTTVLADGAPPEVRADVARRVLDIIGLQAAALPLETSAAAIDFALATGGRGSSTVVGQATRLTAPAAAFANGVLAHSLDYDDTHLPSILHPSASVVPAVLAVAEQVGSDGPALLDAIAVGIETVVRVGMAGYDLNRRASVFFEHGQHATSICGAIGSAAAVAGLLELGERGVADAIGVAASMASGILEGNRTGGTVKRLHCGWAAQVGVSAGLLVERGFTGPPTALEGRFGLFEAFLHDKSDEAAITGGLGQEWEVPGIFFKPYPANHFTHTGLDAAARLASTGVRPEDVVSVELAVATSTVRTIGEPIDVKRRPPSGYQAQFSGPYLVALGFLGGHGLGAGLEDFEDGIVGDARRLDLMQRVSVVGDPECDAIFPDQFPSILRVRTSDGSSLEERVMVNRGGPDRPLSASELAMKFAANFRRGLGDGRASDVEQRVRDLEQAGPGAPAALTALLRSDQ